MLWICKNVPPKTWKKHKNKAQQFHLGRYFSDEIVTTKPLTANPISKISERTGDITSRLWKYTVNNHNETHLEKQPVSIFGKQLF